MAKEDIMAKYGAWAFLIGIVIALVVGIYQAYILETGTIAEVARGGFFGTTEGGYVAWILAVIGAIIGAIAFFGKGTITEKEIPAFLMAGIALVIMGGVFQGWNTVLTPYIGSLLSGVSMSLSIFVAPAVGILAIKAIWDIGKDV